LEKAMSPWEKYAAAPDAGPWAKYSQPAAEPTNPAAANPEVSTPFGTIKGEIGDTAMFNPAAAIIKAGDFFSRLSRGAIEAKEAIPSLIRGEPTDAMKQVRASRDFAAQPMKELEAVHPGSTQVGEVAAMAPIPPQVLPIIAALEEGDPMQRATRAGAAVIGNKLATKSGEYLAKAPERAAAAQEANSVRDALLAQGKAEGLVFPPSASGGGIVSRSLEGLAGKAKTEQLGTVTNKSPIDRMAREELGMTADTPLNPEALKAIRAQAYADGYKPIADLPQVVGDTQLLNGLKQLAPNATGGAIKSPARQAIDDEVIGPIASRGQWTGGELIDDIQILREQARANFGAAKRSGGDSAKSDLANAQIKAADLLEQLAERNIGKPGAVKDLRAARKLIAQTHSVEDALVNGSVNAKDLSGALSGKLALLQKLSEDKGLGKSMAMPVAGANVPITVLDTAVASALGLGGAGVGGFAFPAARAAARYGIMSKPAQNFIRPDYSPSLLGRGERLLLENSYAPSLAGMYGYEAGR
jgi:hypothetical protein